MIESQGLPGGRDGPRVTPYVLGHTTQHRIGIPVKDVILLQLWAVGSTGVDVVHFHYPLPMPPGSEYTNKEQFHFPALFLIVALKLVSQNKMELAMGVAVGSATQVSMFVVPVTVLSGWAMVSANAGR